MNYILTFFSYLDRLSSQLVRQQELSQRASSLVSEYAYKIKEASEQQTQCEGSLSLLVADIKKIKIMVHAHDLLFIGHLFGFVFLS